MSNTYEIIHSKRSTITLQITPDGKIIVHAPFFMPKFFIHRLIAQKDAWIKKKLEKVKKHGEKKQFIDRKSFLYLVKSLALQLVDRTEITIKDDILFFPKVLVFRIQKEMENWYMRQAKEIIIRRIHFHAEKMKMQYRNIFFSDTSSKWGTCFPDNSLQFSWRLVMAPLIIIDYVVIHELVHTVEKNHSRSFWNKVRFFSPAYKQHRKWLNINGHLLL
jgi:predicted metal-dependent hydrolase